MAAPVSFILTLAFLSHSLAAPTAHLSSRLSVQTGAPPSSLIIPTIPVRTSTTTADEPETKYCRQAHTPPSPCVDPPAFTHGDSEFCRVRMCAPKYVEAELCPADPALGAVAKCSEEEITRDVYKCDHIQTKTSTEPRGCTIGSENCKEVQYCSCIKIPEVTSNQLKFILTFKPYCGPL